MLVFKYRSVPQSKTEYSEHGENTPMKYGFRAYLLCAIRNRATLAGYVLVALALALVSLRWILEHPILSDIYPRIFGHDDIDFLFGTVTGTWGFVFLSSTLFGLDTYFTYKRTLQILEKRRGWDIEIKFQPYCNKVGMRLAKERYEKFVSAPIPRNAWEMP